MPELNYNRNIRDMSKRTNEQSKDMDGGDVDITPIKEPNTKKQKVITVQKMEDILSNNKETMTPTSSSSSSSTTTTITSETSPTPLPPKHVIAELLNIRLQLGVTDGSRIEVLWQSEQTEEDVWWPATVNIDMNKLHELGTTIISEEEEANCDPLAFELVEIPIRYDYSPLFPDYNSDEDLESTVSFLHEHKLLENSIRKEAIYRLENSNWTYDEGICLGNRGDDRKTPIEQVPETLAEILVRDMMVPLFNKKRHLLDHVKQVYCAERINAVRLIFIEELKKRQREDRSYIACLDDIELNDLLKFAAEKEKEGRHITGF